MNQTLILFISINILCCFKIKAQQNKKVTGIVSDTTNKRIAGAYVLLISNSDTLNTTTDTAGRFSFTNIKVVGVLLQVSSMGHLPFNKNYSIEQNEFNLPPIILKTAPKQLQEVVIKAKVIPVRLMKDTTEFNAEAYSVRDDDKVEDLLKQLPGITIDADGNASSLGKTLTKIKVNGKDFFTGNLKEFISQLPANIVSKLQVIDDYGDQANFTGIKSGEPQKILNLVMKPNQDRGTFGNLLASAGTNDRYALNINGSLWRDTEQLGFTGATNNINTGAGINTNANAGVNYRNNVGKKIVVSGGYSYRSNKNELAQQSYIETINPLGTIYTQSDQQNNSKTNSNNLDLMVNSKDKENFIQGSLRTSFADSKNNSFSSASQTGIIQQDLITRSISMQRNPNVGANFLMMRHLNKQGGNISIDINGSRGVSDNTDDLGNQIRYYNNGLPVKDSLLNRIVDTRNLNHNININSTFTQPLKKLKDSTINRNIDITYQFAWRNTTNDLETQANDIKGNLGRIDSLSNKYTTSFSTHTIGLNYRYEKQKVQYTIGINAQPNLLTGAYEGRTDKIHRSGFNVSPVGRLSYSISQKRSLMINYNGNSIPPSFNQLQPVPDTRNLQNVIIGNPDLKTAFSHAIDMSYRSIDPVGGRFFQLGLKGTVVQNQVVNNTVLIPDTLNGLKQETRFLNIGGNYGFGTNYSLTLTVKKVYNITFAGGIDYIRQVSFADNQKNFGKGINIIQGINTRVSQKWMTLFGNMSYNYNTNTYSLAQSFPNTIKTWLFRLDSRFYLPKNFSAGVVTSKTINNGYSVRAPNPLLINSYLEKKFFKNKLATLRLESNDLLNQGNTLNRVVAGNAITESKSNQITRYFLISLNLGLQKFGGAGQINGAAPRVYYY